MPYFAPNCTFSGIEIWIDGDWMEFTDPPNCTFNGIVILVDAKNRDSLCPPKSMREIGGWIGACNREIEMSIARYSVYLWGLSK